MSEFLRQILLAKSYMLLSQGTMFLLIICLFLRQIKMYLFISPLIAQTEK